MSDDNRQWPDNCFEFRGMEIPHRMRQSLIGYVNKHHDVGDFLHAVISNDLAEAVGRADVENIQVIPAYVNFLWNCAPMACWGSAAKYQNWTNNAAQKAANQPVSTEAK